MIISREKIRVTAAADIDRESLLQDLKKRKSLSSQNFDQMLHSKLLTSFSTHQQNQNISNGLWFSCPPTHCAQQGRKPADSTFVSSAGGFRTRSSA
jgi:hypothetical protein